MGIDQWEWEGMGILIVFLHTSTSNLTGVLGPCFRKFFGPPAVHAKVEGRREEGGSRGGDGRGRGRAPETAYSR